MAERRIWAGGVAIAACTLWFGLVTLPGGLEVPVWVSILVGAGLFLVGAVLTYPAVAGALNRRQGAISQRAGSRSTQIVNCGDGDVSVDNSGGSTK